MENEQKQIKQSDLLRKKAKSLDSAQASIPVFVIAFVLPQIIFLYYTH